MIVINASNLAAFIGKNPYTTRSDAFLMAWKSSNKSSYYNAHKRNNIQTPEEERRLVREASKFIQDERPEDMLKVNFSNSNNSVFSSMSADIESVKIAEEARRIAYTSHGEAKEQSIIDRVNETVPGVKFVPCDQTFRQDLGRSSLGERIVLQGKIDAISSDGKVVLECKTRVHKLFMEVRPYERLQVLAYLTLVPTAERAYLVEGIFNCGKIPSINVLTINGNREDVQNNDINDWKIIALATADALDTIIRNETYQDAFLKCSNRTAYIKRLVRESLPKYL
jgi:hypothetical protein